MSVNADLLAQAQAARAASRKLAGLSTQVKNGALLALADTLVARRDEVLAANAEDVERARANGLAGFPGSDDEVRAHADELWGGLVGADAPLEAPRADLLLHRHADLVGLLAGAAAARVAWLSLVAADKDMVSESRHRPAFDAIKSGRGRIKRREGGV